MGTVHARQEMIGEEMECSGDVHNENNFIFYKLSDK